ncbi:MAG: tyrosine-type recombinase/integrase [Nitrosotalea sp.]
MNGVGRYCMDRAILKFHNAIKSDATRKLYDRNLNYFLKFVNIKEAGGLLQLKDVALQEMIEDYVIWNKDRGLRTSSINGRVVPLELFMAMNDRVLNFKKIKKMYPARVKSLGGKAWTTKEIQSMLKFTVSRRNIAIILVLASSGVRIGGLVGLKLKHLTNIENCKAVLVYADGIEEYTTFFSPEATVAVQDYLNERVRCGEYLTPDTPLFRTAFRVGSAKVKGMSLGAFQMCLREIVHKVRGVGYGRRTDTPLMHGFRKFFNTNLKNNREINPSIAEKMMGHFNKTIPLDTFYHIVTNDVLFTEYKKAILDLTIDDSERLKIQNKLKDEKIQSLETAKDKVIAKQARDIKTLMESVEGIWELLGDEQG